MNEVKQDNLTDVYPEGALKELADIGVFIGRKKSKTHPRMRPYILATRNEVEIINLQKTMDGLNNALGFVKEKTRSLPAPDRAGGQAGGGKFMIVGTQPHAAEAVAGFAKEFGIPYVNVRWLGGLITNFKVISKRIDYYKKLKSEFKSGAMQKYTKKEQLGFEKELKRLDELFGGLENYSELPGLLIVIDPSQHAAAIREAKRAGIPIVAYVNTDCDPEVVEYPVVGNTKARASVSWFLGKLGEAIKEGKIIVSAPNEATNVEKLATSDQRQATSDK